METVTQDSQVRTFRYVRPETDKRRTLIRLARTDVMMGNVQYFKDGGGENTLHSHGALDGFWFVLGGEATFYGEGDVVLAKLGKHEGILIPRTARYWFESTGKDEDLEILQVEASARSMPSDGDILKDRKDFTPRLEAAGSYQILDGRDG